MRKIYLSLIIGLCCSTLHTVSAQNYETGVITVMQPDAATWFEVSLKNTYVQPVIIAGPITDFGDEPAGIRIRNITATSFEYQLEEFEYTLPNHIEETFSYFVIESGVHTIDGKVWEAGITQGKTDNTARFVPLAGSFDGSQAIFTQLASEEDPVAAIPRIHNVTGNSFELTLYEEEALDQIRDNPDDIHFLAVQAGSGVLSDGQAYTAGTTAAVVDHNPFAFSFPSLQNPVFLAASQTINGVNPFYIRYDRLTSEGVNIRLQEEQSANPEVNHDTKEEAGYLAFERNSNDDNKRLLWAEEFWQGDGTTSDNGTTKWSTDATGLGTDGDNYFEVRSYVLEAKNTDSEVVWMSEEIPITGYDDVKVSVDVQGQGDMENADYIRFYYKVDGGSEVPLINGLWINSFGQNTAMIGGLAGNTLQVVARVRNSADNEYYHIDNVYVFTESNDRYAIQDGDWNDATTWSYTPNGPSCNCLPDQLSSTYIDGFTVTMDDPGYTRNLTVYDGGRLNCAADGNDLFLYGDATLDVKSGGRIEINSASNITFTKWNSRELDSDQVRSGVGLAGISATINIENTAVLQIYELSFDAAGEYTFQGAGNIELRDDLDINNEAEITNNLGGAISIDESLQLDYPNVLFTNNGNIVVADELHYEQSGSQFVNNGSVVVNTLSVYSSAVTGSQLTNSSSGIFEVNSTTSLGNAELTISNYGSIEMSGTIDNVEAGEGLFHNYTGAVWMFGGSDYDRDLQLFSGYENNEFHYNGSTDQNIITPQDAYWHLTLSNKNVSSTTTSIKTPTTNNLDIDGNLTMIGTAEGLVRFNVNGANADINLGGDWWQDEQSGSDPIQYWEGSLIDDETVIFDGTGDQRIRTDEEYISININKSSGQVLVENSSRISGKMTFTEGIVVAQNDVPIVLRGDAQALLASDASHVIGKVTKKGAADFTFPTGDGTHYRPLGVSSLSESSHFTAEHIDAPPANSTSKPDSMVNLAPCGYWQLTRPQGNAEAYVTLSWDESSCPVDIDEVVVARWDGTQWVSEGRGALVGNAETGSVTSAAKIADFGTSAEPALFALAELSDFPIAVADTTITSEDISLEVNVLTNDTDASGLDPATLSIVREVQHGSTVINPVTGAITYTPDEHFFGVDSLHYTVRDSKGLASGQATLLITVASVNDTPIAVNDEASTAFRTLLNHPSVLINDTDPVENDALTATLLTQPTQGTLTFYPDGSYSYAPDSLFYGTDSFTYQVCDAGIPSACDTATVTITVLPPEVINSAPLAQDDLFTTDEEVSLTANVLANDTDPDGDFLMVTITPIQLPEHGTADFSDNGTLVYTPSSDFYGTDQLQYQVCDNASQCDTAMVTITVSPVNDAPVALNDTLTIAETAQANGNLLDNDYDVDQDQLTALLLSSPAFGAATLNEDGSFSYTPSNTFAGQDQFTYQVCDQQNPALCDEAIVTIIVTAASTLQIPKGFSPNADAVNDEWVIQGIRAYPDNTVKVFNRWGNVVYQASGYDNFTTVWKGEAGQAAGLGSRQLPDGTYFYTIDLGGNQKLVSGYLLLKR